MLDAALVLDAPLTRGPGDRARGVLGNSARRPSRRQRSVPEVPRTTPSEVPVTLAFESGSSSNAASSHVFVLLFPVSDDPGAPTHLWLCQTRGGKADHRPGGGTKRQGLATHRPVVEPFRVRTRNHGSVVWNSATEKPDHEPVVWKSCTRSGAHEPVVWNSCTRSGDHGSVVGLSSSCFPNQPTYGGEACANTSSDLRWTVRPSWDAPNHSPGFAPLLGRCLLHGGHARA
jgi:hypothetical protein